MRHYLRLGREKRGRPALPIRALPSRMTERPLVTSLVLGACASL